MAADVFSDVNLFSEFEQERNDQKFVNLSDSEEKEENANSSDTHPIKKKLKSDNQPSPILEVVINDDDFSRKYRHKIESFLDELVDWERHESQRTRPSSLRSKNWNENRVDCPVSLQYFHEFKIDRKGCRLQSHVSEPHCSCLDVIYEELFKATLPVEEEDAFAIKREQRKKSSCFNCEGEHNLSECPLPKDQYKIRENRRKHQENSSSVPKLSLSKNYSDFEDNPRFKKFQPGQISEELRDAMGVNLDQLPPYIYRMRVAGYPPGWMLTAKKGYSSGIKIFDKEGKETNLKGETLEEGEINAEGGGEDPQLEPEKIIEYPGFTVHVPAGVVDECELFNMPPVQAHQLKDTLMKQVSLQETVRKRQAEEEEEMERKRLKIVNKEADMEMSDEETETDTSVIVISDETSDNASDFPPPLPVDTPPRKPPLPLGTPPVTPQIPHPPTPPVLLRETSGSQSPSFENLEAQHRMILQQLNEDESSQSEVEISDGNDSTNPGSQKSVDVDMTTQSTSSGQGSTSMEESDSAPNSTNIGPAPGELMGSTMSGATSGQGSTSVVEESDSASNSKKTGELMGSTMSGTTSQSTSGQDSTMSGATLQNSSGQGSTTVGASSSVFVLNQEEEQVLCCGTSLGLEYGTPILETSSSNARLPDRDKFKQGTEEHLLFENLPGATGTFSKMRELLGKIKSKLGKKK